LIALAALAKTLTMGVDQLTSWFQANRDGLLTGVIVGAVLVALMLLLRAYGERTVRRDPLGMGWRAVFGRMLSRTSVAFMILAAADVVATYAELPHKAARLIDISFVIAFAIQGAVWGRELVLGVIGRRVSEENGDGPLASAMAIIRVLVSVALFSIAGILILDNIGVNVTALVAGLGIGGIAIGLAAQGVFSDLFAALAILFDKPFKKGDTIQFDQTTGTVERIGLKTTRLRSLTGEQVVMANTKLLEREIRNYASGASRRSQLPFGLVYQTDPDQLEKVPSLAKAAVESRKGCNFVRCALKGFGASSIDYELIFDSRATDANKVAADRTAVALAVLRAFAEHGLQFAYPTQTSFTAAPDGRMIMPYPAPAK
jgi:small-conductance mechanosensitive channel